MAVCATCSVTIRRNQRGSISCTTCKNLYHCDCVSLKQEDIDYLANSDKSWSCQNCLKKTKKLSTQSDSTPKLTAQSDFKLIISQLDALRIEQSKLTSLFKVQSEKFDSLESKFTEVFSQLTSIKEENRALRNDLNSLVKRVDAIETNNSKYISNEEALSDFSDRQTRSKNIIIFNVRESINTAIDESDSVTVNRIFEKIGIDIRPITLHRLGKLGDKIRPIKIMLQSASEVFKILSLSRLLKNDQIFNEVRITSDRTPKQRIYLQNLRKQLSERISNGEQNLTIKFVNGQPSIISNSTQKN